MLVPLESHHFDEIEPQDYQADFRDSLQSELLDGRGWALIDGPIYALFGYVEQWEGRGAAWSVLSRHGKMLTVTKAIKQRVWADDMPKRLEILVEVGYHKNVAWAEALGFMREGVLRCYYGDRNFWMMARIKND